MEKRNSAFDLEHYLFFHEELEDTITEEDYQDLLDSGVAVIRKYTSEGLYPLAYVSENSEVFCPNCAAHDISEIVDAFAVFENIISCGGCGEILETAYNEPENHVIYEVGHDQWAWAKDLETVEGLPYYVVSIRPLELEGKEAKDFVHLIGL